jgi:hypothetical protein
VKDARRWGAALALTAAACSRSPPAPEGVAPVALSAPALAASAPPVATAATRPSATAAAAPVATAATPSPAASALPSAPAPGSCDDLRARFDKTLAGASGACHLAADCACHPLLPVDGATGVTDRATARALQALSDAYHQRKCPTACATGPGRACAPTCAAGRCQ